MHAGKQGCTFGVDSQWVELAAEVFTLLSDPTRIRIVLALREGEMSVGRIAEVVDRSPTSVSQHLAKLRWGRTVRTRQDGTRVYYSLIGEHARQLVTAAVFQAQHAVEDAPQHHHQHPGPQDLASAGGRA